MMSRACRAIGSITFTPSQVSTKEVSGSLRLKAGCNSPVGSHPKRRPVSRLERALDPLADAYGQTTAVVVNMGLSHPVVRSHRHHDIADAGAGSRRVCACSRQASRSRRMSSSIAFNSLNRSSARARRVSDRTTERLRHEAMAKNGIVSIALDFRSGNEDPYPSSVQDINYAVRWAKLNARALKTRAELVGLSGQSSGGHLAMLVAMRPRDARYLAIPLPAGSSAQDATVGCVLMSWPVINPLSRYRHAKRAAAGANPPEWPKSIIPRQDAYWRSEANMAEGNPMLALERGEKVETPPAVWFQGRGDVLHDYKDADASFPGNEPQRFVANYRKAGGEIALEYIDAERHAGHSPDLSKTGDMFERMVVFIHRHIKVSVGGI